MFSRSHLSQSTETLSLAHSFIVFIVTKCHCFLKQEFDDILVQNEMSVCGGSFRIKARALESSEMV